MDALNDALDGAAADARISTIGLGGKEFTEAVRATVAEHTRNKDDAGRVITTIKWCAHLKKLVEKLVKEHLRSGDPIANWHFAYDEDRVRACQYRPFTVKWLYWDERLLSSVPVDLRKMFPLTNLSYHTPAVVQRTAMLKGG